MTTLRDKLFKLLKRIPKGRVTTYKNLAEKLNTSARAVGSMLRTNPHLIKNPCHRVIKTTGELGGYKQGSAQKKKLLINEGVLIKNNRVEKKFIIKRRVS